MSKKIPDWLIRPKNSIWVGNVGLMSGSEYPADLIDDKYVVSDSGVTIMIEASSVASVRVYPVKYEDCEHFS